MPNLPHDRNDSADRESLVPRIEDIDRMLGMLWLEMEPEEIIDWLEPSYDWLEPSDLPNIETLLADARQRLHSLEEPPAGGGPPYEAGTEAVRDDELRTLVVVVLLGIVGVRLPAGNTAREEGRRLLVTLLQSPRLLERWGSALALGIFRDEAAFPVLLRMLSNAVPPPLISEHMASRHNSLFWETIVEGMRQATAALLWRWGDPSLVVPAFRQALQASLAFERSLPRPRAEDERAPFEAGSDGAYFLKWSIQSYVDDQKPWLRYAEVLLYGLGVLGGFGALAGLDVPIGVYGAYISDFWDQQRKQFDSLAGDSTTAPLMRRVFYVQMALGALGRSMLQGTTHFHRFTDSQELTQAVDRELALQFGLDEGERRQCLAMYDRVWLLHEHTDPEHYYARLWRLWD